MVSLPSPGTDRDVWGAELNAYIKAFAPIPVAPITAHPEVEIQAALDIAAANVVSGTGQTAVKVAPGVYVGLDIYLLAGQSGTFKAAASLYVPSGVTLDLTGVTLKLKNGVTLPATATNGYIVTVPTPGLRPAAGGTIKQNVKIIGGTLDGNGANQSYGAGSSGDGSSPLIQSALMLGYCQNSGAYGTKAINVWGNAGGPPGESFHFHAFYCEDVEFIGCTADGSALVTTATGFSAGNCQGVRYISCVAHGLGAGQGFTNYLCSGVTHEGCYAYLCGAAGFNTEIGYDVAYSGCISGGQSPLMLGGYAEHWAYPGGQEDLANEWGWTIQGSVRVTLDGACNGSLNTTQGVVVKRNPSVTPNVISDEVLIQGMFLGNGSSWTDNVFIERASDGGSALDQGKVIVSARIRDDVAFHGLTFGGVAPVLDFDDRSASGVRYWLKKDWFLNPAGHAWRWIRENSDGTPDLEITDIGQVVTKGRRITRVAKTGNYTAASTDEYVGCTGTATTAQTITLPAAASVGAGAVFTVKDEAGGAATHNITIAPNGVETIDGSGSVTIGANYGHAELVCTGTAWNLVSNRITPPVTSAFARTGAVVAGNADYLAVASGGLTGAVAASRYVGGTSSGAPSAGTFAVGDFVIDQTGMIWICTVAGTSGTWVSLKSRQQIRDTGLGEMSVAFPLSGATASIALAAQALRGTAIGLKRGDVVTNILASVSVAAGGTAGVVNVGLYSAAYGKLAVSGDVQSQLTSLGPVALALTAPYTVTADGLYYPVIDMTTAYGTTQPSLAGAGASGTSAPLGSNPVAHFVMNTQPSLPTTIVPGTTSVSVWLGVS